MKTQVIATCLILILIGARAAAEPQSIKAPAPSPETKDIKSYCLDFNWAVTGRRRAPFAAPGTWAGADPAQHVAWYKAMGANVIQTFCVSTNGYAWYKNGFATAQPGLKHDFLPEVVKLGHQEGMRVFGYFCISANPVWAAAHPDQSYGTPTTYHIPYTDEYLAYLSSSISDAVRKTGIDGIMLDWLWMPNRTSTQGKWLGCEKKLYQQLMGEPFPGEEQVGEKSEKYTAFSRKALDRCWKAIHKAAKEANPDCIIWLTSNQIGHPHVVDSDIYKESDWLMNEAGSLEAIRKIEGMVGKHTHLITCMALWNGQDASKAVPEALASGVGLYGFAKPANDKGLIPLENIFSAQVCELTGDDRNIAVLARAYHGKSVDALWKDGKFVEPANPPPFHISLKGRGRGNQDTASISHEKGVASVTITTPYNKGRATLTRNGAQWPASVTIRLRKTKGESAAAKTFRLANGNAGFSASLDGTNQVSSGALAGGLDLGQEWGETLPLNPESEDPLKVTVKQTAQALEIVLPPEMIRSNPEVIALQWN